MKHTNGSSRRAFTSLQDAPATRQTDQRKDSRPMTTTGGDVRTDTQTGMARVAAASFVGTAVEYYDFFLFGTAAALIFGGLFFPGADPLSGTLLAFATFGVGFFARPLGGIIAGHLGDRIGRKKTLVATLLLM